MGCSGCGSARVLPGSLTAQRLRKEGKFKRVKGYSGGGILKSQKRLLRESGKYSKKDLEAIYKGMEEASKAEASDLE